MVAKAVYWSQRQWNRKRKAISEPRRQWKDEAKAVSWSRRWWERKAKGGVAHLVELLLEAVFHVVHVAVLPREKWCGPIQ